MYPKSDDVLRILARLGFTFELSSAKAKHPKLLVFYEGIFLPENLRFPIMRGMLRLAGVDDPGPLADICFVAASRKGES